MGRRRLCIKAGRAPRMQVERAVSEVQPNDLDEQARDTVNKGWSKDQWISGVLERAIGIVARSADRRGNVRAVRRNLFGTEFFLRSL